MPRVIRTGTADANRDTKQVARPASPGIKERKAR